MATYSHFIWDGYSKSYLTGVKYVIFIYWFRSKIFNFFLCCERVVMKIISQLCCCLLSIFIYPSIYRNNLNFYSLSQFYFRSDGHVLLMNHSTCCLLAVTPHTHTSSPLSSHTTNCIKLLDGKKAAADNSLLLTWNCVLVFSHNKMELISSCFMLPCMSKMQTIWMQFWSREKDTAATIFHLNP